MLTQQDLSQLREKGITQEQVNRQLAYFSTGFPFLQIVAPASYFKGIMRVDEQEQKAYLKSWQTYLKEDRSVTKFVPASGAASRMFKDLYAFLDADYDVPTTSFEDILHSYPSVRLCNIPR